MSASRVAITGIGVIAPGANDAPAFWDLISAGKTSTRNITAFDASQFRSRIAAEIDFDPYASGLTAQEVRRMDRSAQLAVVAARESIADSGLDMNLLDPYRVGVTVGTAVGATTSLDEEFRVVSDDGSQDFFNHRYAIPNLFNHMIPSSIAAEVAWTVGAQGPVAVVSNGCTSGIDSVGHALDILREGRADVMIAGATDAPISPITVACFDAIKATSTYNDSPAQASRPFDASRNGFVLGEGSAIFVLEPLDRAVARGAKVYAEISGYGSRSNAFHMTGLRPDGNELAVAISAALDMARVDGRDVDYVNAHGSGTKQNDRHETAAVKKTLGSTAYETPVSSIKSMIGHSLGAIGSIEIAASVLAMKHNIVPPTANLHDPDPECDLDYVPNTAREVEINTVLTVGSGFGGFQSAMVLTTPGKK
ncbi:beta-ketoacyl-[acyl-carrier-protein] synthase family protein [Glutamicibacter arilaitensis]|uniref:beta-ketoacyl-[acyl-carrier-protein] synthase family protein n=1 Tax=Glutamicibacter arilaitensis TaxID=256701 RepID=UPI003FD3BDA2